MALAQLCAFAGNGLGHGTEDKPSEYRGLGQGLGLEVKAIEYVSLPFTQNDSKYLCHIKSICDLWKILGISLNSVLDKNTIHNKFKSFSIIVHGVVIIMASPNNYCNLYL